MVTGKIQAILKCAQARACDWFAAVRAALALRLKRLPEDIKPVYAAIARGAETVSGLDRLPLFCMMFCVFVTSVGFFFGKSVSFKAFWLGLIVSFCLALMHSIARALSYLLVMLAIWLVTAYTFTYVHWDASVCHFPMAQALVEGWNPVLEATNEGLKAALKTPCNFDHILCAPKITALSSAIVSKGTNLFTATMFLPCCLFIALFSLAYRFAVEEFGCSKYCAAVFATCVFLPVQLMNYLMYGTVDSVKFASTLSSVFAMLIWWRSRSAKDAVMFWMCLSTCSVSKTAGFGIWLILGGIASVVGFRRQLFRRLALCSVVFFLLVGASPYVTQWIHGGSPFYPAHTFVQGRATKDLTGDFISSRNDDALDMGYLGRVVYAWFSPKLATKCSGWCLGRSDYKPTFSWPTANGYGDNFSTLMCLSLLLLPCVRNRKVAAFFGLVFLLDNLTPAKYLGFCRYFPEMYAIPFVTFMGAIYCPRWSWRRAHRPVVVSWQVLLSAVAFLTVWNLIQWYDLTTSMEKLRQDQYAKLSGEASKAQIKTTPHWAFGTAATRRLLAAGMTPVSKPSKDAVVVHYTDSFTWFRTMVPDTNKAEADRLVKEMQQRKQIRHGIMGALNKPLLLFANYEFGGYGWPSMLFQPDVGRLWKFKKESK